MFSRIAQRSFPYLQGRTLLAPSFQAVVIKNGLEKRNILLTVRNFTTVEKHFSQENLNVSQALTTFNNDSGKNLVVPLKDVFKKYHDDIEDFRQDKPEVYKLLKHILESDACVTKAQADAVEVKVYVSVDRVHIPSKQKAQLLEMNIKLGKFSRANRGEDSEESRIVKAWNQLMKEVNPVDKTQLLRGLDDLMSKQWPCNIVGCYLSQHLEVPRHPLKVFEVLASSVLYLYSST